MAPYNDISQQANQEVPNVVMELDTGELSEEMLELSRKLLGETAQVRDETLINLRNMIADKGDVSCRTDDEYLLRFLRARKFNVDSSYKLLKNYLHFKKSRPEIHQNVWPQRLKYLGDDDVIVVPPYKDQEGRRMTFFRIGNWVPSKYKVEEIFKASVVVLEMGLLEKPVTVTGAICLFDLGGISLSHVWNITPSVAETLIDLLVRSFPIRLIAIHIVNQPMIFNAIYAIFKQMLDKRMQESIFFHGSDMESLHRHISPKHLPKRYGGIHEEFSYRLWLEHVEKKPEVIDALHRLGYNLEDDRLL